MKQKTRKVYKLQDSNDTSLKELKTNSKASLIHLSYKPLLSQPVDKCFVRLSNTEPRNDKQTFHHYEKLWSYY